MIWGCVEYVKHLEKTLKNRVWSDFLAIDLLLGLAIPIRRYDNRVSCHCEAFEKGRGNLQLTND